MKNTGQPINPLMKFSPVQDLFHEPKQTYSSKEGWFAVNSESSTAFKGKRRRQKKN